MLYLVRHGQAGPRGAYDALSTLGISQSRLLGKYFAQQRIRFDAVMTGTLVRQQDTARYICSEMQTPILSSSDAQWNEIKLGVIYREIAARLCADEIGFAAAYQSSQQLLAIDPYATGGAVAHCDRAVMQAWMTARYQLHQHEEWTAFQSRIESALSSLLSVAQKQNILVVTSALPIITIIGQLLQLSTETMMELVWGVYNTSLTRLEQKGSKFLAVHSFNEIPHLAAVELQTLR